MKKSNIRSLILILFIVACGSVGRIAFNNYDILTNFMGIINSFSLLFVFYIIIEESESIFLTFSENDSLLNKKIKTKKKRFFRKILNIFLFILSLIGLIYGVFFSNPIANDIISLIALFFSIETNLFSNKLANFFYYIK